MLESKQIRELAKVALKAAEAAALYIRSESGKTHQKTIKSDVTSEATQVITAIDIESQRLILEHLNESITRYDLGLLTEECQDDGSRFVKDYFWCIDPLDGTLPFTEQQAGYVVSVALVDRFGQPIIGVVVDPHDEQVYQATKGQGFQINGLPLSFHAEERDRLVCHFDRSFLQAKDYQATIDALDVIAQKLGCIGIEVRTGPGAVMNALDLLDTDLGCYLKRPKPNRGGGCIWDFAATCLMYQELGLHVSDSFGNPLQLNSIESVYMNQSGVIYSTDPRLAEQIIQMNQDLVR